MSSWRPTERRSIADPSVQQFWERRAVLTEKGVEVLRGAADRVELYGIDRWLGGAHLSGGTPWRRDGSARELGCDAA